jgi:hypothetical protein
MRIFLNESSAVLRQLRLLYLQLPVDLRTDKVLIPASELILEAIEYIVMLKNELENNENNNNNGNTKKNNNNSAAPLVTGASLPPPAVRKLLANAALPPNLPDITLPSVPLASHSLHAARAKMNQALASVQASMTSARTTPRQPLARCRVYESPFLMKFFSGRCLLSSNYGHRVTRLGYFSPIGWAIACYLKITFLRCFFHINSFA